MIREGTDPDSAYLDGIHAVVTDKSLDPAARALMLGLPSQSDLARELSEQDIVPDPAKIYAASEAMRDALAERFAEDAAGIYEANTVTEPYRPDAEQAGKRSLANAMLLLITRRDGGAQAEAQYEAADNMTQQLAALANLIRAGKGAEKLADFEKQWQDDRLVMDKWFGLQVIEAEPDAVAETVERLTAHPAFNWKNPNRFRAVIGSLGAHHAGFHHAGGAAYRLMADWLIRLDPLNPQTTARMSAAFQTWKRYDSDRQDRIAAELDRILSQKELSRDTTEMLTRIREA
jgi:aminopeptidase N